VRSIREQARGWISPELIAVLLVTPLVIVLGEVVPKSFVRPRADRLVSAAGRIVRAGEISPVSAGRGGLLGWRGRRLRSRDPPDAGVVTREELSLLLQANRGAGRTSSPTSRKSAGAEVATLKA
jgi:CBS domain containing-hemolysin-like protein